LHQTFKTAYGAKMFDNPLFRLRKIKITRLNWCLALFRYRLKCRIVVSGVSFMTLEVLVSSKYYLSGGEKKSGF